MPFRQAGICRATYRQRRRRQCRRPGGQYRAALGHGLRSPGTLSVLIEKGADVSAAGMDGDTPLHIATWQVNEAMARLRIEKGD
jgi:hypothetical protein